MTARRSLREYLDKRDFTRTGEPGPEASDGMGGKDHDAKGPVFVIQQHAASSMHFDFRLEVDGVLASWAVPKGPSTDPTDKRLAVRTEDHPLEYASFEGVIPEGEYGAGAVIVWDAGIFENVSEKDGEALSLAEALDRGHVRVRLAGEKLSGVFSLVHARLGGQDRNWLLVKEDDEGADARRNPVSTEPESVLSGRTVKQVEEQEAREEGDAENGGDDS